MYIDWKSVEIVHQERVDHYVKSVLEDEPKFSIWQRPQFGAVLRSIAARLARLRQRSQPRHAQKRQDRRRVEWV